MPRTITTRDVGIRVITDVEIFRGLRGILPWITIAAPIIIAIPMLIGAPATGKLQTFTSLTLTGWGTILPVIIGLIVALSVHQDKDSWLFLLASPISRSKLVIGKFLAMSMMTLVSSAVLILTIWISTISTGIAFYGPPIAAIGIMWVASLGVNGLMILSSVSFGLPITVGIGAIGVLAGALTGDKALWFAIPFAWPLRSMLPFGHVYSSGVPLPAGSPLTSTGPVFLAIALSLALTIVTLGAAARVLIHKEI